MVIFLVHSITLKPLKISHLYKYKASLDDVQRKEIVIFLPVLNVIMPLSIFHGKSEVTILCQEAPKLLIFFLDLL